MLQQRVIGRMTVEHNDLTEYTSIKRTGRQRALQPLHDVVRCATRGMVDTESGIRSWRRQIKDDGTGAASTQLQIQSVPVHMNAGSRSAPDYSGV